MSKSFDEAGSELAENYRRKIYGIGHPHEEAAMRSDFLSGRDSCKEALRDACDILTVHDTATARRCLARLKALGCYVGEES